MWRSLVAHFVRDEGAAGSNPVIPIRSATLVFLVGKIAEKVNGANALRRLIFDYKPLAQDY
jgi:hypothetical protein